MSCLARVYGSQTICVACGLNWDTNDAEPPTCGQVDRRTKLVRQVLKTETLTTTVKNLPDRLPDHLAVQMERAFNNHGMQAAYRVLLDELGN